MKPIPALPRVPLLGNLGAFRRDKVALLERVAARCGPVGAFHLGPRRLIVVSSPELAGKVQKLLVSGTNDRVEYDEPTLMKEALVREGVPEADIVADYAGRRTLDTVVRAKEVFGLKECIFVTDDFHMARTLWLADQNDLKSTGFASSASENEFTTIAHLREIAAGVLVVLDVKFLHTGPRFLGKPESI